MAAGKFAVVLGDRVSIPGRHLSGIGVADGSPVIFIECLAQLQFERIHIAQELLMHLLHQGWIPGEAAGVQITHLLDQRLQLALRLRIILYLGANLVKKSQALVNLALRVGRVGTGLRRHRVTGDPSVARVPGAIRLTVAIARPATCVAYWTSLAIACAVCLALLPRLPGSAALRAPVA